MDASLAPPFEAYNGPLPYAFVSYAHKDADTVFPEIARLHAQGFRIWYDEGIDPGNEWPDEVARSLAGCSLFMVFISPEAVRSQNVRNEVNYALNKGKTFLAIHIVETPLPSGLELRMGDIQAIMKYRMSEDNYCRKIEKVLPSTLISEELAVAKEEAGWCERLVTAALKNIVADDESWMFGLVQTWLAQDSGPLISRCLASWDLVPPVGRREFERVAWALPEHAHIWEKVQTDADLTDAARRILNANRAVEPNKPITRVSIKRCSKPVFEPPWHTFEHAGMGDVDFYCKQCRYDGFSLYRGDVKREVPHECPRCALGRRMPKDTRRY
jgi:hypothetical protein